MNRDEVMQMALDALERFMNYDNHGEPYDGKDVEGAEAIEALRTALAQPEPEPVAWLQFRENEIPLVAARDLGRPVYIRPPQREWIGLTDEELNEITWGKDIYEVLSLAEAKLKEKNGY